MACSRVTCLRSGVGGKVDWEGGRGGENWGNWEGGGGEYWAGEACGGMTAGKVEVGGTFGLGSLKPWARDLGE